MTEAEVSERGRVQLAQAEAVSAQRVEVGLLGPFHLHRGGRAYDVPASAQRLIAFLALQRGAVQRLFISGILWPDTNDARASACLRSALWRLREPECPVILATGTSLRLAPGVAVDLDRLMTVARQLDAGDRVESTDEVADRFDDDLLPDWYDDWVVVSRERWRQVRLHALEALAAQLQDSGAYGKAVSACLSAVRADCLRESAHRALIRVHLAEGNFHEARRQYLAYRRLLSDEMGLEPSPLMEALVAGVIAR